LREFHRQKRPVRSNASHQLLFIKL
jgi:hypothetical protein